MKTTSMLKLRDLVSSAASFAVGAMVVFVVVATNVVAQQLPESCAENHGTWLAKYQKCKSASQQWCQAAGGHFDECGSACRHASEPGPCTMQCVPVCKFASLTGNDAADSTHPSDSKSEARQGSQTEEPQAQSYVRDSQPQLFSYDELVRLSLDQPLSPELAEKLRVVPTTPFVDNEPS